MPSSIREREGISLSTADRGVECADRNLKCIQREMNVGVLLSEASVTEKVKLWSMVRVIIIRIRNMARRLLQNTTVDQRQSRLLSIEGNWDAFDILKTKQSQFQITSTMNSHIQDLVSTKSVKKRLIWILDIYGRSINR
ncbi:hypothetical protein AVEN_63467-1 [Araneus ventricosus]|uniref:Uncharacterized protein n=1 Tax=Araneus ventricosus TaxID=182803 RepID=A0A4Y2CRC7_ARAVE|nr:hypothetical protein AVEN_63467-1 [Araneus ventricosus]